MDKAEKRNPFFTVVMPAYGVEKYIDRAISSIRKQTFEDWEIIVVDDCTMDLRSTDAAKFRRRTGSWFPSLYLGLRRRPGNLRKDDFG